MLHFNIPLLGPSQAFAAAGLKDLGAGDLGLPLRGLELAHLKHQESRGFGNVMAQLALWLPSQP